MSQQCTSTDFGTRSTEAARNIKLQLAIGNAVMRQYTARQQRMAELPHGEELRTLASRIKQHTLDHLDYYIEQLTANVERRGGKVHFAKDADDARRIILGIARSNGVRRIIKSKSMVSEEVDLGHHLQAAGMEAVETDLGEFIIQIAGQRPSHIVGPCIHMNRASIASLFTKYFNTACTDDPTSLTMRAREHLREKFRHADMGMTGGNFLVAETGQVCTVENEGNARQSTTTPRILVSLVGIEKIVPRMADLAVMLKLLPRSATGQHTTVYTNIFGGVRQPGEKDGPEQFHLVLIDNGRAEILASDYRQALRCIRCGACLNSCPVYRKIGGHAYGHVYSGPIGSVLTPLMQGLAQYHELPTASSLCGACHQACPVKIDLPGLLVQLRRDLVAGGHSGFFERLAYRSWAWMMNSSLRYWLSGTLQRFVLRRQARGTGWVQKLPRMAAGWTNVRDLPAPAPKSFHKLWRKR